MSWGNVIESESDYPLLYKLRKDGIIETLRISKFRSNANVFILILNYFTIESDFN